MIQSQTRENVSKARVLELYLYLHWHFANKLVTVLANMLNGTHFTTADVAVNKTAFGDHHPRGDTLTAEPRGESTPRTFTPSQPTQEDRLWPLLLDQSLKRFISTVREMSARAQSTSSLPDNTTERQTSAQLCIDNNRMESNHDHLANRDTPRHHSTDNGRMPTQSATSSNIGSTDPHDTSDCQLDPSSDSVMPKPPTTSIITNHQVRKSTTGHPDRQSPPPLTAQLTLSSCPPDEDPIGPKRVAVSDMRSTSHNSPFRHQYHYRPNNMPLGSTHHHPLHPKGAERSQKIVLNP